MDPLPAVLGRIAEELEEIAARLGAVTLPEGETPAAQAVMAWQEIDQSQQRAQALAVIVGRLQHAAPHSPVDMEALTAGIGLDAITDRIMARAPVETVQDGVELF